MNKETRWNTSVYEWVGISLIILTFIVSFVVYPSLPEMVPSHWNIQGQVNGYSSRFWGAFGIPLLNLGIFIGTWLLPKIDPHGENYKLFSKGYRIFRFTMILFFTVLYAAVVGTSLGYPINVGSVVQFSISVLFIVIGNYMSTFRHNYFCGIRTPWTLANEKVWQKTHRLGAKAFVIAGFIGIASAFGPVVLHYVFFGTILAAALIPAIYSYFVFKNLEE